MDDSKIFMFPDGGTKQTSDVNSLLPLLMMNCGGMNGGGWMWIIFLFFLYPLMRNGGLFGNACGNGNGCLGPLANMVNNNDGRDLLMQAINGNGAAVQNLASTLNCDINSIKCAINGVQNSICQVGNQVGMSGQQIINAIQQGNMGLTQQIAQCCCDNKLLVTNMGYESQIRDMQNTAQLANKLDNINNNVVHSFSTTAYETAQQTCALQNGMRDQTQTILSKLDSIEDSRKDRQIADLTAQLTAATSRAERAAELAPITKALSDIQCKQPNTVTVPYQPFVTVPNCIAYQGLYGYGTNPGVWG